MPSHKRVYGVNHMKKLNLIYLLVVILPLSACIRFTPSTDEVEKDSSEDIMLSEDGFFSYERDQTEKLNSLLKQRENTSEAYSDNDYRIGGGDVLQFEVFDVKELTREVRVRPTGSIALPLMGTLEVEGLTEGELQQLVTTRLKTYMHNPQVTVRVSEYDAHRVFVIGEVAAPGTYPLTRQGYSLVELIAKAGGRTDTASGRILLLPAAENGGEQRASLGDVPESGSGIEILWDDVAGTTGRAPRIIPLLPGDTIIVPEAGTVEVDGDIERPGSYQLSSRMTVLGAIAAAGGLTYSSDAEVVEIIRETPSGAKALVRRDLQKLSSGEEEDIRLRDGDVVRVPSESGRFVLRQVTEIFERIFNFGLNTTR